MSSPVAGSEPVDQLAAMPASEGPLLVVVTAVESVPVPPVVPTASVNGLPGRAAAPVTTLATTDQAISANSCGTVAAFTALARSVAVLLAPPASPGTEIVLPLIVT